MSRVVTVVCTCLAGALFHSPVFSDDVNESGVDSAFSLGETRETGEGSAASGGQNPWKQEFERICAQTEVATSLSKEQLQELIADSEELMGRLAQLKVSGAKVYIFRLKNCKAFLEYALELLSQGE